MERIDFSRLGNIQDGEFEIKKMLRYKSGKPFYDIHVYLDTLNIRVRCGIDEVDSMIEKCKDALLKKRELNVV